MTDKVSVDSYFTSDEKNVDTFSSGCTVLDEVLGGGWAFGRISNVVGNRSAGKTLLAIEAAANYKAKYTNGRIYYAESESAFDVDYAEGLGLPVDSIEFAETNEYGIEDAHLTVEGLFEYFEKVIEIQKDSGTPAFIIVDSLDAYSDRTEVTNEIDKATFGANKAKMLSQMFRRIISQLNDANITIMFISQIRDNIGGMGAKHTRSGGKALDFYCSQIIWITETGKLKKTSKGVERPVGVKVKAQCKKNKVGLPFRECHYQIHFGFGIDNIQANIQWLQDVKAPIPCDKLGCKDSKIGLTMFCNKMMDADTEEYNRVNDLLNKIVHKKWMEIEQSFLPKRRKYS